MQIISYLIPGVIIALANYLIFERKKSILSTVKDFIICTIFLNIVSLSILKFILNKHNVLKGMMYKTSFSIKYIIFALICGLIYLAVKGIINSRVTFTKAEVTGSWKLTLLKVISVIFVAIGVFFVSFSKWFIDYFGNITPEQFLFNLNSPIKGTSSDMYAEIMMTPVFTGVACIVIFLIVLNFKYDVFLNIKNVKRRILNQKYLRIVTFIFSIICLIGGVTYGAKKLSLDKVYKAYVSDSSYIKDNYADPRNVKMSFPEKKRNLIHIYLESVENSYLSKDLGGYMKENLMPELTELSKEGIHFSESNKFGGPYQTYGSSWSVASMVNMSTGLPLKIPMGGNSYGKSGSFLPGAVSIGDILKAQGYEQTIMFGADADFGGLTTFFGTHGDFNIFDYKAAKEKKLIPQDYNVWWGFEDDKLYKYAKDEITRLSKTGKPFNFTMETADTHFPDGYLSKHATKKHASQYANVISYSTKEAVNFIKWIQKQPFYKDTTIVVTGDHLSMDKKFFKDFDKSYHRTVFNLILNPATTTTRVNNRKFSPVDMYPTILASMGVQIEGDKLGLGTNLFSDKQTLIERDGLKTVQEGFEAKSNFFNNTFISEKMNSTFTNKLVTERKN
ncbi:LTA synthase family protein [Clostridium baratii]|uniref:alkaline phosphatase family protein n=1 Tax=Clostridium baratii TaxID=1561 RepID=UPI0005F28179|nr:alkaline phosphatase family protein [Clostridium baratii]AQM59027.1 sulfatase [Clostridium baratii]KJU70969.1 sulfatase [Clostridium baratii]MBS6041886.1 sulfatase-like hydrolase/transferase [Clostridium baratii]